MIAALACALGVAWVGLQVWRTHDHLSSAQREAKGLAKALARGNADAARARLTGLERELGAADAVTSGVTWRAMGAIPLVGDSFEAVRTLARVGEDLSGDGLEPLVVAAGELGGDTFAPRKGRVAIERLPQLQEPVRRSAVAFARAEHRLAAHGLRFVPDRIRAPYQKLVDQIADATASLATAQDALKILPGMLGGEGRRSWILAVQNNAEIRSSGGMPGSQALIRARDGRVRLTDQVAAADFGVFKEPVLPQSEAERAIYDVHPTIFPADTNFTPEFPRTAELMAAMWKQRFGVEADGVVSLDVVTLSYLLGATGPVQGPDGTLDADNLVDELVFAANLAYPDPEEQNAYYEQVTAAVTEAVFAGRGSASRLLAALRRGVLEDRVKITSFNTAEQEVLLHGRIAGALPLPGTDTPYVGVYVNDATGSKMSYFLRYRVELVSTGCTGGRQQLEARATFSYRSPEDPDNLPDNVTGGGRHGTPAGEQLLLVRVYGPHGGEMSDWTFDGEQTPVPIVVDRGRPVASPVVQLRPGEDVVVRWQLTSGAGQADVAQLAVTPGVRPGSQSGPIGTRCGRSD